MDIKTHGYISADIYLQGIFFTDYISIGDKYMDLDLIFLDLKFKMIEDDYTNIKIEPIKKDNYIIKAEDLRKPQSTFVGLITNGHISTLTIFESVSVIIKEYNFFTGEINIDCEYSLNKNAITKRLQKGRNVEY